MYLLLHYATNILIFLCIILFFIYLYYQNAFKYWLRRSVPHLKPSFPLGNFDTKLQTNSGVTIQNIYKKLKKTGVKYGGFYMLASPIFLSLDPEINKDILIKNYHHFDDHGFPYGDYDPMSAMIICLKDEKWKYLRSQLTPIFTSIKLKRMFDIMKERTVKQLRNVLNNSKTIEIQSICSRYTIEIIFSCAFGIDLNIIENPDSDFMYRVRRIIDLNLKDSTRMALAIFAPHILKLFKICFFNPNHAKFFYDFVKETIEFREKNNVKRNDLMDLFIKLKNNQSIEDDATNEETQQEGKGLTLNQIAAQTFFFFLAGFETSAVTLSFCMYEIAKNPEIQDKVREDILKALEGSSGEITYEMINNLPYIDKVIQETHRMYPPIHVLNRICTQDYHNAESKITIEKGTKIVISILGLHTDPEYYPQPDIFDPERFSEQEKAKRPSFSYLPFGEGPKMCLGPKFAAVELKLAMVILLQNFKYSVNSLTKQKIKTVNNGNMLTIKDEIWLNVTKI